MAKIISVVSGKGGTGKSTISAGLALSLSNEDKKVLIVDFDIGLRALDIMLGVENSVVFDLGDVLNQKCTDESAMIAVKDNLTLMCTPMVIDDATNISKMLD
ncbi:MAG: P-loop NTPase, partial [Oscillospiraceae bacterium]